MTGKKLYIQTFGCQMNVQDSEKMAALLEPLGYRITEDPESADLILLNTCSIREKAEQKVYSQLGRFRALKRLNPRLLVGVGGCLAQQYGDRLGKRAPVVDLVFGTHQIHRLPDLVRQLEQEGRRQVQTGFTQGVRSLEMPASPQPGAISTFVTIMQGCNNFCAYCVVPYLRGAEVSRPLRDVVAEVDGLARRGIREVTLLGQNVNSYGSTLAGKTDFAELLQAVAEIPGIERIRFTTSHPKDLSPRLIACFGQVAPLCEHIHLPVQSGANRVLARMNRGYTVEAYLERVAALRSACPDMAITSDMIVGFPGEGEEEFEQTLRLMEQVRFDNLFSFAYSEREGTAAIGMDRPVDPGVRQERLRRLQKLQSAHTLAKNQARVGSVEAVLVEGPSKTSPREMTGRTRGNKIVNFPGGADLVGQTVPVRIVGAFLHSLKGERQERGGEDVR